MPFSLDVTINPQDMARAQKRLDKWKGAPLAIRTQRAAQAGMKLFIAPLRARAERHNLTGRTQRGYAVRKLRKRNYTEIAQYKASSNTWYKHFAIVGTSQGVPPDPYVSQVKAEYQARVVSFIESEIVRLA